jgi:hypothetical protein
MTTVYVGHGGQRRKLHRSLTPPRPTGSPRTTTADGAPRSPEHGQPWLLSAGDMERLRDPLLCQLDGLWCARLEPGALG